MTALLTGSSYRIAVDHGATRYGSRARVESGVVPQIDHHDSPICIVGHADPGSGDPRSIKEVRIEDPDFRDAIDRQAVLLGNDPNGFG